MYEISDDLCGGARKDEKEDFKAENPGEQQTGCCLLAISGCRDQTLFLFIKQLPALVNPRMD